MIDWLKRLISEQKMNPLFFGLMAFTIGLAVFLRVYNFSDWLHFELDQARDVRFISAAVENGPAYLPVLGPKAGGTFLKLGPAYYYLEYLSALVFGNTPEGHAAFVPLFSILSLPFFYWLMRRYFSHSASLSFLALYGTSIFFILYSRFAWNPNLLPFAVIFGSYALLKAVDQEEKKRNHWFLGAIAAAVFATQLHFIAFLAFPVIGGAFLLIKRPKFDWKVWLGAAGIILFFYFPVLVNEVATEGSNSRQFILAISDKGGDKHSLLEKGFQNSMEQSKGFAMVLSGNDRLKAPKLSGEWYPEDIVCSESCRKNFLPMTLAIVFWVTGVSLLIFRTWKEKDIMRRDFLWLAIVWFGVVFVLFLPLAYDIFPRFFLLITALPYIFLGLIGEALGLEKNRNRKLAALLVVAALVLLNLSGAKGRFAEMKKAPLENFKIREDNILRERARVTLEQEQAIIDAVEKQYRGNHYPVYIYSEAYYRRAFRYLLEAREIPSRYLSQSAVYRNGNQFAILRTSVNPESALKSYLPVYRIIQTDNYGTLTLYYLAPKPEAVNAVQQDVKETDHTLDAGEAPRLIWKDIPILLKK